MQGTQLSGVRATAYSTCIGAAVRGTPQRGIVHSVFAAAANIVFPHNFVLSLNCASSACMPNGLQLSVAAGTFPFSALRSGMPVLLGAFRLHVEAIQCSLDLSLCRQWNPHVERPEHLDMDVVRRNGDWLAKHIRRDGGGVVWGGEPCGRPWLEAPNIEYLFGIGHDGRPQGSPPHINPTPAPTVAHYLCGRGVGLTPTGDDILAGWMAVGWLLYGPIPNFLEACQQIVRTAERQTHLLSQCWLRYAAAGDVTEPIRTLLAAMTQEDTRQLEAAADAVLALGATSGYDMIQGILLGLGNVLTF
jgi:Protein of unknown function (DUF2877)